MYKPTPWERRETGRGGVRFSLEVSEIGSDYLGNPIFQCKAIAAAERGDRVVAHLTRYHSEAEATGAMVEYLTINAPHLIKKHKLQIGR